MKRVLSLILALALVLSCAPQAFAVVPLTENSPAQENELESVTGIAPPAPADQEEEETVLPELTKYESSGWERFSPEAVDRPAAEDVVTFIVVIDEKPQLELYSADEIASRTAAVQTHAKKQETVLNAVKNRVKNAFGSEEGFQLGFTYTIATTGFSVRTAYGNKAALESMENVKKVYVAPTFTLPENQDFEQYTNNASTMIGAHTANETGYTGKGMRVAILDTGIKVDHPSFGAMPNSVLVDPMTRESVEAIWSELNAGQMTNMLNTSYYNNKIPFVFNYSAGTFDVSNTYAGSDHGTHVAGITAANKLDSTSVVGVAPDAQLVVMQVFETGGGAEWATIMAALEDCVRLEVDAANLSLGAAAGFVDPEGDMLDTLNLFLETDIQILIASGNDTNNAYMNAWGMNMSLIENPDIGLAGTPSTYSAALAVGSMDNNGFEQMYITVGGREIGFQDTAVSSFTSFIQNFRAQELEYVVVPGVGAEEDYAGIDVTGKIALVSRGDTSFPEKQAMAQEKGAIGVIVYNNTLGFFGMQINDGEGNIPAVSISKSAGEYMITEASAEGVGILTVCDADIKLFKHDITLSDFSSWGVTPDLKLKPEIAGVGGSIYSAVDPAISGSNYGYMSGTSMATPQITGAMAVLIQYLDENYPELTGVEQRQVAAALMMSTANPILSANGLEYSPRAQGAGLADLVKATTTPAYLTNAAAPEGRPKVEFGDDPAKNGVYTFSFTIHNLSGKAVTYEISSSVLTEQIELGAFIANAPYALEAEVVTDGPVTVPARGSVTVNASVTLTENDKAYLNQFPNGIYVEGYVYATPVDNAEGIQGVTLSMPMVGFYGDWSDANVFDSQDTSSFSLYPAVVYTYMSQMGTNPYFRNGASGDKYNAFSYANPLAEVDFGMLRNAKRLEIKVTDKATGEVYHTLEGSYMAKTFYNPTYGQIIPTYLMVEYGEIWDGKTLDGKNLPDGTGITYSFDAWLDDGDDIVDDSWSFSATLDNLAPELLNEDSLQDALRLDTENGRSYLTLEMLDNQYIAAVLFVSSDGAVMGKYEVENVPGETITGEYEITGFGSEFSIVVADYACNETEVEVLLDLGDQNDAVPDPAELSKDRIYGCETFTGAALEGGWFSANKADFSDAKNETYNSENRYYAAEYVNGYLIAQSYVTGHLELVIPSGSYWSSKVLAQNYGAMGDPNVWSLYDMALDHSGTLAASYGVNWETDATDALLAVGWLYRGDNDGDGKDDGYNALFNIKFTNYGDVQVQTVAPLTGTDGEILTLGITTEGKPYALDTNGILYSLATTLEWDDSYGEWGENVVKCTKIGVTDFVNYPNYDGVNVVQSMGYDHNTGKMYWFAHSQYPNGPYYDNVNMTYEIDLETGKCTEVGTYGPGGQTCLFVPNDLVSDLFTLDAEPKNMSIVPNSLYLVEGQTERLKIEWSPWNATPADVTWASLDENILTVDEYGFVTAVAAGTARVTASAELMLDGYWDSNWVWVEPGPGVKTVDCMVTVLPSEDALYGYVVEDYGAPLNNLSWVTYSDKDLRDITVIGKQYLTTTDPEGNEVTAEPLWAGGTYYNGYVYSTVSAQWTEDNTVYNGTQLYRSKVTPGATPAETTIGEAELIGVQEDMLISALAFDYNTGRMYCVENQFIGGLGIIDLETGEVDMLGQPNGDLSGGVYIPGLCVTRDGTIVISDAVANLYTIDPDTLTTKQIHQGEGSPYTAFYEAMFYDYNTDSIYWNMCDGNGVSPLYLVILPEYEWEPATVVDMGSISTKNSAQQTILFSIPENEPETNVLPVQSIEITKGDTITGLEGGSIKLGTATVPERPTIQKKTWTSSDENVVTVDGFGNLTYVGVGTATVTVSITNKDEASYGGPFTDSIRVTVLESAGEFVAFLNADEGGSDYYDFWLSGRDYDLRHTTVGQSMIAIYSLRTGVYYDGCFYGYTDKGQFLRIDANDPSNYKVLGNANLDYSKYQVTGMAVDYASGTLYGLTLPSNYDYSSWTSEQHPGELVTIDMNTGLITTLATMDFSTPVFALACDAEGQLYAAGGTFDLYAGSANIYKVDKQSGALELYTTINGARVLTGPAYYGTVQYNAQMTYDWGTDRLYLYATADHQDRCQSYGMYMIQLGEDPTASYLDGISLNFGRGDPKIGDVYLGLLAFIPEADEIPVGKVNGIMVNTNSVRMAVGTTTQMTAEVRPSNAADKSIVWTSEDETVATVDENGLITGVAAGSTTVTVTSNETGVSTVIRVTVVNLAGVQSTAYTVSAQKDALISFNPNLPSQTAETVVTMSGGSTIGGMAMGDGCIYYVVNSGYSYFLHRFDLATKQSIAMGQIESWFKIDGLAYDKENNLFYVAAGFYLFVYDATTLDPAGYNNMINYVMDSDYCTLTGVSVIDGAVYAFGNDYSSSAPTVIRYSDKYLSDRTVILKNFDMSFVAGATDIAWDGMTEQFYMTDAGHTIFAMDMDGNVEEIGILGDGIDLNGLAIDYMEAWQITYTDGVGGKAFSDKVIAVEKGGKTPAFPGEPTYPGYTFAGWTPDVAELATEDAVYTAAWTANSYTVTFDAAGGEVDPVSIQVTYDTEVGELPVPTRKNHDFAGWFDEDGNEYTAETIYTVDGDVTLTAQWNEHPVIFRSVNTSLGGNIGLNFYVKLADEIVNDPNTVMRFTFDGRTVTVPMSEAVVSVSNGETRYRFTCRVTSKHMADPVTAQIITSEGAVGAAQTMSVETYCNYIIANSADDETVAMMKAMLNYGAAAQVLFDHNTGNLANAQLSDADKVLADVDASAWKHTITGTEDGIKLDSAVLLLDSETSLRIYFVLNGDKTIDEFTFQVDGVEVEPIQKNDRYYLEVRNIAAHNLDVFHQFTIGGLTMDYSVMSYINTVLNVSGDEAAINMAKALYAYGQAVEAFVN